MELLDLTEEPLEEQHTLARAVWRLRFTEPDEEPLTLPSSYLLRRTPTGWRVVVYLNPSDVGALLRDRRRQPESP